MKRHQLRKLLYLQVRVRVVDFDVWRIVGTAQHTTFGENYKKIKILYNSAMNSVSFITWAYAYSPAGHSASQAS